MRASSELWSDLTFSLKAVGGAVLWSRAPTICLPDDLDLLCARVLPQHLPARHMALDLPPSVQPPVLHTSVATSTLRRGLQHGGSDLGFARLFSRLHAGKPVRVLAFGTSVTGVAGGCTHSLLPYCESCCGTRSYGPHAARREHGGFLRVAFHWINSTWPHAEHRLYNGGRPGAGGLGNFVGCLSSWIPEAIDLFLLEVGGTGSSNDAIERLARDVYRLRPRTHMPAIAIYDMWNFRWRGSLPGSRASHRSNRQFASGTTTAELPPSSGFTTVPFGGALARYYGWPVVSEHDSLYLEFVEGRNGLIRSAAPPTTQRAKPPWQVLKPDLVHPSMDAAHIYGDLISIMLYQAYELWRILGPHAPMRIHAALRSSQLPPPLVVSAEGDGDVSLACFTFDAARLTGDPKLNAPDAHMIDAEGGLSPHVLTNRGWQYVRKVRASARANKPGLLAVSAGAILELRVLPLERNIAGKAVAHHARVSLTPRTIWMRLRYLVSYERHGTVRVTCTDGCTCAEHTLNAHQPARRESVEMVDEFSASIALPTSGKASVDAADRGGAGSCALRLEVLRESTSAGHEFKITRLVVNAMRAAKRPRAALGLPFKEES